MADTDNIPTYTGQHFNFEDPDPDTIVIEDIAHHLSLINRWRGGTKTGMSVAQHSIIVREMAHRGGHGYDVQLACLMHDASEAYLGDLPSPVKAKLPMYKAYEQLVTTAICMKFGIKQMNHPIIKLYDTESYRWEARDLLQEGHGLKEPVGNRPHLTCWTPAAAEEMFLNAFGYLMAAKELQ